MTKYLVILISLLSSSAYAFETIRDYTAASYYISEQRSSEEALELCKQKVSEVYVALELAKVGIYSADCIELRNSLSNNEVIGFSASFVIKLSGITYIDDYRLKVGKNCEEKKDIILQKVNSAGINIIQSRCEKAELEIQYLFIPNKKLYRLGKNLIYKDQTDCLFALEKTKQRLVELNSEVVQGICERFTAKNKTFSALELHYISSDYYGQNTIVIDTLRDNQNCTDATHSTISWSAQDEVKTVASSCLYYSGGFQQQITYLYNGFDPIRLKTSVNYNNKEKCKVRREQIVNSMNGDFNVISSYCKLQDGLYRYYIFYINYYDLSEPLPRFFKSHSPLDREDLIHGPAY